MDAISPLDTPAPYRQPAGQVLLHAAVIYVPFLQPAFSTESLGAGDWLVCVAMASSVLWLRELSKLARRR